MIKTEGSYLLSNGATVTCLPDGTQKDIAYVPGTLSSCEEIYSQYGIAVESQYLLSNYTTVTCKTDGTQRIERYTPGTLSSCNEIYTQYGIAVEGEYLLSTGETVTCKTDGTVKSDWYVGPDYATRVCGVTVNITKPRTYSTSTSFHSLTVPYVSNNWITNADCQYGQLITGYVGGRWNTRFEIWIDPTTKFIRNVYLRDQTFYKYPYKLYKLGVGVAPSKRKLDIVDSYGNTWNILIAD